MGVVTEYLKQLLIKQVEDRGLVVWYDPERAYTDVAAELALPQTTVVRYDGSFFRLRREIDHLMNDEQPPRLVVYVPLAQRDTHNALIELEAAGVVMQPGQQPLNRNTKLVVVARHALKKILGEEQVAEIERQVESGKLRLSDLDALAEKGKGLSTAVLALIFGTDNPQEVALAFLSGEQHDDQIERKSAQESLRDLLGMSYDFDLPATATLTALREHLARHVLLTDLVAGLGPHVPAALSSVPVARSPGGIDSCVRLARTWRNSRDARDSYVAAASKIEQQYSLTQIPFEPKATTDIETFPVIEKALLQHVEAELLEKARPELLEIANARKSRFWAEVEPTIQARWALVATAAEVLLEADRVGREIKSAPTNLPALVKAYAEGDAPWCLLDTHHRNMESRKYNVEYDAGSEHYGLDKLVPKAEQRYTEVGSALAKHFVSQLAKAKHPVKGLLHQRDLFETQVKPKLDGGKVAYVWVDALRFEMGRELARLLKDDYELELQPALATGPTITEIGMAALLPKAHEPIKVVSAGDGKLAVEIGGQLVKDRKDRVAFLKEHAGVPVFDCKLDDLLPKPDKRVKNGIQSAQLILVTSQEIDELGEGDNSLAARLMMDWILDQLRRAVRILADHNIKSIIVAADHGHIFANEIGEDMKIEAPGGETADLHRRVWVGVGGTSERSYLRIPLKNLGLDSELDLATPWNFAVFKSKGGAQAYFHGGLSPQEVIIPVLTLYSKTKRGTAKTSIKWTLTPGSAKLTTRFFSVQIAGEQSDSGLFEFEPPKVRVEIRANEEVVSVPVSASYGFEDATGEVKLRVSETNAKRIEPNTVALRVHKNVSQKTVDLCLVDATTNVELAKPLKIEVAISM